MPSSTLHALTLKAALAGTEEFYLVQSPFAAADDRRTTVDNIGTYFAKNTLAAGSLTASAPMTLTQTWGNVAVTFIGMSIDITSTASAAASEPFRVRVGGTGILNLVKDGKLRLGAVPYDTTLPALSMTGQTATGISWSGNGLFFSTSGVSRFVMNDAGLVLSSDRTFGWAAGAADAGAADTILTRDAANTLTQRNGTTAQITRGYRTFTDTSNYERWALQSGVGFFELAAETAGTGTDNIDIRLTPAGGGNVVLTSAALVVSAGFVLTTDYYCRNNAGVYRLGTGDDVALGRSAAGVAEINNGFVGGFRDLKARKLATPLTSTLTIATGVVTITGGYHAIDTEAAAATDDLDTINGGTDGDILTIRAANDARTVVVKDATGNLQIAGDMTLDNTQDTITLRFDNALSAWLELGRAASGA